MLKSDTGRGLIHPTPKTSGVAQTPRICQRPAAAIGRIWSVALRVRLQLSRRHRARPRHGTLERPNQSRSLAAPLHGADGSGTDSNAWIASSALGPKRTLGLAAFHVRLWLKADIKRCLLLLLASGVKRTRCARCVASSALVSTRKSANIPSLIE
jgi:hypothetical protein